MDVTQQHAAILHLFSLPLHLPSRRDPFPCPLQSIPRSYGDEFALPFNGAWGHTFPPRIPRFIEARKKPTTTSPCEDSCLPHLPLIRRLDTPARRSGSFGPPRRSYRSLPAVFVTGLTQLPLLPLSLFRTDLR